MKNKAVTKGTYWEKLKDPRWQKKRLEILGLHEFACQECGSTEDTLHVHHPYYEKNKEPWEYDDETLMCVCENCHKVAHHQEEIFNEYVRGIKKGGNGRNLMFFAGIIAGYSMEGPFNLEVIDCDFAAGLGVYFKRTKEEIISALDGNILPGKTIYQWVVDEKGVGYW